MEVKAKLNYLRMSPRKVRLVANLIKGMNTKRALLELGFLPKRSALPVLKLLKSAVANAKHNFQLSGDALYIKSILVNQGTTLKRFTPRAFGRASPIRKRTSHILLTLDTATPAKPGSLKSTSKEPLVRDVTREDIKEEFMEERPKSGRQIEREKPKIQVPNFVRRVFKRKVI
jgi:large subunit ribosomal protein L22